jgi:hypothetical protein
MKILFIVCRTIEYALSRKERQTEGTEFDAWCDGLLPFGKRP